MRLPSANYNKFSAVPHANIQRSAFDRTHTYKTTFDAGYLIPFYVDEALPGDTFNMTNTLFARLATPIVPIMDNMYLDTFYFAVPYRLIWDNWQKFCGEQTDPDDPVDFLIPQIEAPDTTGWTTGTLADYFGLPTGVDNISVSALPFRAYNLIWNEWFRSQVLQDSLTVPKDDGPDPDATYALERRCKRMDYFTSCLPWPQKGPGVELIIGGSIPVSGIGKENQTWDTDTKAVYETGQSSTVTYQHYREINPISANYKFFVEEDPDNAGFPGIFANLEDAITINALRQAFQLQKMYEKDARGGTRYIEIVRAHFGVDSPDLRATRPIYLGGKSTPVVINPVQQTSSTDATTPQGNLAGFGTVASVREGFVYSFTEHCVVLGLCMVRADLTYQEGIERMWSRRTRFDFYWPTLAHLGEQAVLNKEIYAQGDANDDLVFGYQERWAEYRYKPSKLTGLMRSEVTSGASLDVWHLAQDFDSLPTLGDTFIRENPPVDRVIAVTSEPHFIMDSYLQCRTVRPMPVYSVPGLVDHF